MDVGDKGICEVQEIPRFWPKELDTWRYQPINNGDLVMRKLLGVLEKGFIGSV